VTVRLGYSARTALLGRLWDAIHLADLAAPSLQRTRRRLARRLLDPYRSSLPRRRRSWSDGAASLLDDVGLLGIEMLIDLYNEARFGDYLDDLVACAQADNREGRGGA